MPLKAFDAFDDLIYDIFRAKFGGLPARVTRDMPMRRTIEREIHASLSVSPL